MSYFVPQSRAILGQRVVVRDVFPIPTVGAITDILPHGDVVVSVRTGPATVIDVIDKPSKFRQPRRIGRW